MPMFTSSEGLQYKRYTFKPLKNYDSGGCRADVYLPDDSVPGPLPIALYFHGGAFTFGDTQVVLVGHNKYLLDRGFCVVSAEFRMSPHGPIAAQREDWVDAYRWTVEKLSAITAGRVDGSRMFAFGVSGGATASLWLGIDSALAGLPPLKALYVVYPCTDFMRSQAYRVGPNEPYSKFQGHMDALPEDEREAIQRFLDGPGSTAYDNSVLCSPWTTDLEQAFATNTFASAVVGEELPFSPKHDLLPQMTSSYPPTVLIQALSDVTLDPAQTSEAYDRLKSLGVDCNMISVPDMKHGDIEWSPVGPPEAWEKFWDVGVEAMEWCIERCGVSRENVKGQGLNGQAKRMQMDAVG